MPSNALEIIPLIKFCKIEKLAGEVWFPDDDTGCGSLHSLRRWWDNLTTYGPTFGYHPNACNTWLITKECLKNTATTFIAGTDVHITTQGRKNLRAPLGSKKFVETHVTDRIKEWVDVPFIVESLGGWSCEAVETIKAISRLQGQRMGLAPSERIRHLFERLAILSWKRNACMWVTRVPIRAPIIDSIM